MSRLLGPLSPTLKNVAERASALAALCAADPGSTAGGGSRLSGAQSGAAPRPGHGRSSHSQDSQLTLPVVTSCIAAAIFSCFFSTSSLMIGLRLVRLSAVSRAL